MEMVDASRATVSLVNDKKPGAIQAFRFIARYSTTLFALSIPIGVVLKAVVTHKAKLNLMRGRSVTAVLTFGVINPSCLLARRTHRPARVELIIYNIELRR